MQTSYGSISQRTAAWAADEMLAHAEPIIVFNLLAMQRPIPKNKADTVKFRRALPFAALTVAASEGVTPPAQQLTYQDVSCQLQQWIGIVEITDRVHDMSEDPVLKNAVELCGEQAGETQESVAWGVLRGGTSVIYGNGSSRGAVNTKVTLNAFRKAVRALQNQRAKTIRELLGPSTNVGTRAVEPGYVAVFHTDVSADVRDLVGFTKVADYGTRKTICDQELGTVENVRCIATPLAVPFFASGSATLNGMYSVGGVNVDVYPIIVLGKDAFGAVTLKGADAITPMVLNPGVPSKSDPAGQRGYVSWKSYYNCVRLNETWMQRIEVGVTSL
jgi:N4-gp56 family major capsid protein